MPDIIFILFISDDKISKNDSSYILIVFQMRIKDTSTVYSYSISVCMGSFVFGYELSSFGNLSDLISYAN
jgi:hypothetical protein